MHLAATTPRFNRSEPVLVVIPARLGATRLPRKPLRALAGKPLIVRVYERVLALEVATSIVVATDDNDVLAACANHNVPAQLTDTAHESGTDRIAEVVQRDEFAEFDIILNVQGDEPFVSRDAVDGALAVVARREADVGTASVRASRQVLDSPDVVKVVATDEGRALYFSRAPIPFLRDQRDAMQQASLVRQHIGVYAYRREALLRWVSLPVHPLEIVERLEQLRALAHGMAIGVRTIDGTPHRGIDTEEDLALANARFEELTRLATT